MYTINKKRFTRRFMTIHVMMNGEFTNEKEFANQDTSAIYHNNINQ